MGLLFVFPKKIQIFFERCLPSIWNSVIPFLTGFGSRALPTKPEFHY